MQFSTLLKSVFLIATVQFVSPATAADISTTAVEKYIQLLAAKYNSITMKNLNIQQAQKNLDSFKGSFKYRHAMVNNQWTDIRTVESKFLLKMIGFIKAKLKVPFDRTDKPAWNVLPPEGSGYGRSVVPSTIKDKKIREAYEQAIAKNTRKTEQYNKKSSLHSSSPFFLKRSEMYIVYMYSFPPYNNELELMMGEARSDVAMMDRILDAVKSKRRPYQKE
ncbi:MAG: hypothetical protein HRT35_07520 [Algicola sp.]|nr:hypothetical protein [Algicola sp.]